MPIAHDRTLYRERDRVERCFNKLGHGRRIVTRFDRRDVYFLGFLHLAGTLFCLR